MEKLRVHGKLLGKYVKESGRASILLDLKKRYLSWSNASSKRDLKNRFIEYDNFFELNSQEIRRAIGSERKFATLIGHRLEEFIYLLFFDICRQKGLTIDKISGRNIISWIGFNSNGKLSVIGHGADLVIGEWRKFTIRNKVSIGIEDKDYFVPKVIIECKQYVSIDMFRDIVTESEMFKRIYPHSLFIIVCEVIEMTEEFKKMKKVWEAYIDGFFAFRSGSRRYPGKLTLENIDAFESIITEYIQKLR